MKNEFLLQRIINGFYFVKYQNKKFKVLTPTSKLRYKTQMYCDNIIDSLKFSEAHDWLSEQKRMQILNYFNIWNSDLEQQLEKLTKNQEQLKVGLYLGFKNKKNRDIFRKKIQDNLQEINALTIKKATYQEYTKEAFIEKVKNYFLIKHTVYLDNKLFLLKEDNFNNLQKFLNIVSENNIYHHIPNLIRSTAWLDYWNISKSRIIKKHVTDWSEEQLFAVNSSLSLDSIKKHPEAPDKEILDDHDATEGWIYHQNKKDEKEKKKKAIEENLEGRAKEKSEVFVMTDSKEEEQEIYDLNDPMKRRHIRKWQEYISQQGEGKKIDWIDIPEVIQEKKREDRVPQ